MALGPEKSIYTQFIGKNVHILNKSYGTPIISGVIHNVIQDQLLVELDLCISKAVLVSAAHIGIIE
jgi:hypothetical protein